MTKRIAHFVRYSGWQQNSTNPYATLVEQGSRGAVAAYAVELVEQIAWVRSELADAVEVPAVEATTL